VRHWSRQAAEKRSALVAAAMAGKPERWMPSSAVPVPGAHLAEASAGVAAGARDPRGRWGGGGAVEEALLPGIHGSLYRCGAPPMVPGAAAARGRRVRLGCIVRGRSCNGACGRGCGGA
jgi:hypothetical protein